MVLPGHIAGGYLATYTILNLTNFSLSPKETVIIYIIGILAAEGPDIDLLWFYFENKDPNSKLKKNHREYPTHNPLLWFAISLIISIIGLSLDSKLFYIAGIIILVGSWTHFILDSFDYGICWLWPFCKKRFSLIKTESDKETEEFPQENIGNISYYWNFITKEYFKKITFYIEIMVVTIAFIVLYLKI